MSEPIWIECASAEAVEAPERLGAQAVDGRHVVLRFPLLAEDACAGLIDRFAAALPDHRVFRSSPGFAPVTVTIWPVVSRARVLARRDDVWRAVDEYRRTCATLVTQYTVGTMSDDWDADEHGRHCRFENRRTGQVVEAPLERESAHLPLRVDPFFFSAFVHTTPGWEPVAELIRDWFHDGVQVLETVAG